MSGGPGLAAALRRYSIPLIAGVLAGLAAANLAGPSYATAIDAPLGGLHLLGRPISLHFLIDDVFMVLFFGLAAQEITTAVRPGGALNPPSRALNPLLGTLGGVIGPALVFTLMAQHWYAGSPELKLVAHGWGIPTATDIALAWLAARMIFGEQHPAVDFLLLLAVADDAIGLGIIAVVYPDPAHPVAPAWLALAAAGLAVAWALRRARVESCWPTLIVAGGITWCGLFAAHLHPALALALVVPFLRGGAPDAPLERFEHALKPTVDWGLFAFAFANAGVEFANVGPVTWIVTTSLLAGKTVGITLCSGLGMLCGVPLPRGMTFRALLLASLLAGIGLTVALFVAGVAYDDPALRGEAKMGALFSAAAFPLAIVLGRLLRVKDLAPAQP